MNTKLILDEAKKSIGKIIDVRGFRRKIVKVVEIDGVLYNKLNSPVDGNIFYPVGYKLNKK
jgi:hypothetical protein